ncbi:uncharacterized protein LOC124266554 isoform X1 [Haliotis rubra]|uniref:uncharacterized protein LOC124266554 isoform X1 n=1 Tax=Haliotis rubra TaxID=36100 RepID=UPI001EE547A6|nr:uncharacterized protein LOC124266554 isoform X1 [Haliotis rubra]
MKQCPSNSKYASRQSGENVTVSVSVLAYPLPTFTWSRSISTSQDLTGSSSPVSDISVTARLHLTNLQQQDFGDYSLTVDNDMGGSVTYTVSIVSTGPPSTPTNVSVSAEGPLHSTCFLEGGVQWRSYSDIHCRVQHR